MADKEQANPAIENNSYCSNGGIWTLNGQNISFENSSSYQKEDIEGFSITWDLGVHVVNNPGNYNYELIPKNAFGFNVWFYWNPANRRQVLWHIGTFCEIPQGARLSYLTLTKQGQDAAQDSLETDGLKAYYSNGTSTYLQHWQSNIYPTWWEFRDIDPSYGTQMWELKITDNGQNFYYDINDKNSVIVSSNSNNAKFRFNINNEIEEIIADKNSIVSVICNCPQNTIDCGDCCLECQDIFNEISGLRRLISSLK